MSIWKIGLTPVRPCVTMEKVPGALRARGEERPERGRRRFCMYRPEPLDTSAVELPQELLELTEKIAENVHDTWAAGRIAAGWTYGEKRDDEKETTPCLVPYGELSEEEKAYDRNTALETLKLIVLLGYTIRKE